MKRSGRKDAPDRANSMCKGPEAVGRQPGVLEEQQGDRRARGRVTEDEVRDSKGTCWFLYLQLAPSDSWP